ncbi:MAG: PPC domain-containing protein [Atribacterota bacterium]|nr:PPC domain-containing protein [Atribacterota bacterium]
MKIKKIFILLILFFIFAFISLTVFAAGSSNLPKDFNTNGDSINGWYWLRDNPLQHYAQWTFENIPSGNNDLILDIAALATDRQNGGRGFPAEFLLIYEVPGGNVFVAQKVTLPNISSPNDSVGYTCQGQVTIPRLALHGASVLFVRIERISLDTNHVAFKKGSIEILETAGEEIFPPYQENQFYQDSQLLPDTNNQNEAFMIQPSTYHGSLGGQIAGGQIDKEDWYSVNLQEGQIINLQLTQPSGGNFTIYLKKPGLTSSVGSVTSQDNIRTLQYVATISGIWFIRINRSSGEGNYQLSVDIQNQNDAGSNHDAGDSFEDSMALYPGVFTGFLNMVDKVDWYNINLLEGQTISLQLFMPPEANFKLYLYPPGSTSSKAFSPTPQGNMTTLQHTADDSGIWGIKVTRSSGEGDYQLSINISGYSSGQIDQSQSGSLEGFTANKFRSNGSLIQGWYWLRDSALQHYAEWTFENIPSGNTNLILDINALATNQSSGSGGFSARFKLIYGFPGSGSMGGVFQTIDVTLPNVSPPSDPVGYTCHGLVTIPRSFIAGATTFFFRVERITPNDNHVAFNQESITLFTEDPSSDYREIPRSGTK